MEQNLRANNDNKWEGKACIKLHKASADQIWSLYTDFFNIHKWFPNLDTCYGIHGNNGEPGCIRYCSSGLTNGGGGGGSDNRPLTWIKERLTAVDHAQRTLSYEVLESNAGVGSYITTVKIVPGGHDHDRDRPRGCVIEWSFVCDPINGLGVDDMVRQLDQWLHVIAHKMEESLDDREDNSEDA